MIKEKIMHNTEIETEKNKKKKLIVEDLHLART